jgi:hypothetical protein
LGGPIPCTEWKDIPAYWRCGQPVRFWGNCPCETEDEDDRRWRRVAGMQQLSVNMRLECP